MQCHCLQQHYLLKLPLNLIYQRSLYYVLSFFFVFPSLLKLYYLAILLFYFKFSFSTCNFLIPMPSQPGFHAGSFFLNLGLHQSSIFEVQLHLEDGFQEHSAFTQGDNMWPTCCVHVSLCFKSMWNALPTFKA